MRYSKQLQLPWFFSLGLVLAAVQAGFGSALGGPWPHVSLALALMVSLISRYFFSEALAVAVGAGFAMDVVSPWPYGTTFFCWLITAAAVRFFQFRVLTSHSAATSFGLQMAGLACLGTVFAVARIGRSILHGWPLTASSVLATSWAIVFQVIGLQIALVVVAFVARRDLMRRLSKLLLIH